MEGCCESSAGAQADGAVEHSPSRSCRLSSGVALLTLVVTLAWVGACLPWASTPDALQEAVSKEFEQPQRGLLSKAQQDIQQEYGRLAALNGWNHQSNKAVVDSLKDNVHAQVHSIAHLGADSAAGSNKAQTLFDDFASPRQSAHQFFKSSKTPPRSFKAELKTLARQQKDSQAEVDKAISKEQAELDAMTHRISALSKKSEQSPVIAIPVAKELHHVPTSSKLTASKAFIVDPEAEFKKAQTAEREANIAREGGSVHDKPLDSSADVKPPRHDPFAPKFAAGNRHHDHETQLKDAKDAQKVKLTQQEQPVKKKVVRGEEQQRAVEHKEGTKHAQMKDASSSETGIKSKQDRPKTHQASATRQKVDKAIRSDTNRGPLQWPALASVHARMSRQVTQNPQRQMEERSQGEMEREATELHRGLDDLRHGVGDRRTREEDFGNSEGPGRGTQEQENEVNLLARERLEEEKRREDERKNEQVDLERIREEYEEQAQRAARSTEARLMFKDHEVKDLRASRNALKEQLRAATRERNHVVAQEARLVQDLKHEEQREEREERKDRKVVREEKAVGRKVQLASTPQVEKHVAHQQKLTLRRQEREVREAAIDILQQEHLQQERDQQVPMQARVPLGVSQGRVFPVRVPGGRMMVRVPWGSKPGDLVRFRVPKSLSSWHVQKVAVGSARTRAPEAASAQASLEDRNRRMSSRQIRLRQAATAKLQELKHLLSESEARERRLEMRSLAMSPPTLATPEEKELARTIAQERKEEDRQYSLIKDLSAKTPQQKLQAISPRQAEKNHFMHVLQAAAQPVEAVPARPVTAREAEIAADAVEVAAQTKARRGFVSSLQEDESDEEPYQEEEEEEEEPYQEEEEDEEDDDQEQPYEEEEPEEDGENEEDEEPAEPDEESGTPEVEIQKAEPVGPIEEQGHSDGEFRGAEAETEAPDASEKPSTGGMPEDSAAAPEAAGAGSEARSEAPEEAVAEPIESASPAQVPANEDVAWPPAARPSAPTLPTGHPDMAWPRGQPKGWGPQEDVGWHAAPPSAITGDKAEPVVVAVPVGPADDGKPASPPESSSGGAEAMAWPVPGYEDPIMARKGEDGELSWPGSTGKENMNPHVTPAVPATMPSDQQQPAWFHAFVSAVKGSSPSAPPPPPPPPAASASDWFHSIVAPVASIGGFSKEKQPEPQQAGGAQGDDIAWGRAKESRVARASEKNAFLGRKGLKRWKGPGGSDKGMTWPVNADEPAPAPAPAPAASPTFSSARPRTEPPKKLEPHEVAPGPKPEPKSKPKPEPSPEPEPEPEPEPVVQARPSKESYHLASRSDMIKGLSTVRMTILIAAVSVFICLLCIPSKTVMGMLEVISPGGAPEHTSFADREQSQFNSGTQNDDDEQTPRSLVTGQDGEFATMLSSLNDVKPKVRPETAPDNPVVSLPTDSFYQAGPSEPRRGSTSPRHSYV